MKSRMKLFQGRCLFPGKPVARLLFLLSLLSAAIAIVHFCENSTLESTVLTQTTPLEFSKGWRADTPNGLVVLREPSRPEADRIGVTVRLVNALPDSLSGDMSLCFQSKNEIVRVWVAENLVYVYGETPQLVYGHGVGAVWNLVPLPENAAGKAVTVELTPIGGRTGLSRC